MKTKQKARNPVATGILGGLALFLAYFLFLTVLNSFSHALGQFRAMWYWVILLSLGFGTQIGLYIYAKNAMNKKIAAAAEVEIAATGGISAGSMLACCLHHVTDVLPLLGISALAMFLTKYQTPFILIGVFSNLVGTALMLGMIQKHKLAGKNSKLNLILKYDMKSARNIVLVLGAIVVILAFIRA